MGEIRKELKNLISFSIVMGHSLFWQGEMME